MSSPRPAAPDGDRPLAIAHRFGNEVHLLAEAAEAGVDLIEADVWFYRRNLEVRHLKTMGPVPLLWDRRPYRLARANTPRMQLEELAEQLPAGQELMLDLKGTDLLSPKQVVAVMRRALPDVPYTVCSQSWGLLEEFRDEAGVRVVHSVGNQRMLRRVLDRLTWHDQHAISIDKALLDAAVVRRLRDVVPLVMTWRVNDRRTLHRVVEWGVNGVISDELHILREVSGRAAAPPYHG